MKTSQILTSDFTSNELVNCHTYILEAAKKACSSKITFFQNEINTGHTGMGHIENLELYMSEFRKWVPIVAAAKARDKKQEAEFLQACNS
jgi:hypothetical protein